jgi:hypothetical protein
MILAAALAGGLSAQSGYYDPEPKDRPDSNGNSTADKRWSLVGRGADDGLPVYIDTQTLEYRPSGAEAEYAWVWLDFTQKDGGYMLVRWQIHRTNGHIRVLSFLVYGPNRELLKSDYKPSEWVEMPPGSVGEMICQRVFPKGKRRASDV